MASNKSLPQAIVISTPDAGKLPPPPDTTYRAVHQIRLSSISHNFTCVESAATRQRCSVIVVVKADGYGHGAIESAVHLADHMGADAFAVATLEEGIALRKAFESTPPVLYGNNGAASNANNNNNAKPKQTAQNKDNMSHGSGASISTSSPIPPVAQSRSMRPAQIRIIVLGPPVGFPRCFDDYYHYGIEVMCSGPEVAKALMEWIADEKERKRLMVERAANDAKAAALTNRPSVRESAPTSGGATAMLNQLHINGTTATATVTTANGSHDKAPAAGGGKGLESLPPLSETMNSIYREPMGHATLGNVSGQDLAKEVRAYLVAQQAAKEAKQQNNNNAANSGQTVATAAETRSTTVTPCPSASHSRDPSYAANPANNNGMNGVVVKGQMFGGIEAVAKNSRTREMAVSRANGIFREDSNASDGDSTATPPTSSLSNPPNPNMTVKAGTALPPMATMPPMVRKRLRYHVLVDSGMGRLGFKTQPVEVSDVGVRRDTVEIISELVEMEVRGAPIEFFGMCTHMADANSTSTYTNDQMNRFKNLLKRVRAENISIPTVSTDNSAALLTTNLTHFDAKALLSQPNADTRGFVRTGGAIYGQRPAFTQLKAVSTLIASVRHVAVLKQGESVGYDRAYIAPHAVRIATLTIGFADGYPRDLGNGVGKVAIRGHLFPVAGNVCMDMMMVELGAAGDKDCPGAEVVVGDTAVLWGPLDENDGDGLVRLQDLAGTLKTTQSALTCGLDKIRVLRQYV